MHHCHHGSHKHWLVDLALSTSSFESIGVILALSIMGLLGSFVHCIGMCGPIAMHQVNMRLLSYSQSRIDEWTRLKCAAAVPYYLGKATTYGLLAVLGALFTSVPVIRYYLKYFGVAIMLLTALFFLHEAFNSKFSILSLEKLSNKLVNAFDKAFAFRHKFSPFGIQGFILGMLLGLLPCGLVYSSLSYTLSLTHNNWVAGVAMFAFGLGTIPGLFLISYFGQTILYRWNKVFRIFYTIVMLFNVFLLVSFAYRYLY